jgi:lysophospholipase L1-like esterase
MKFFVVFLGFLAAFTSGLLALFTVGQAIAVLAFVVLMGIAIGGLFASPQLVRGLAVGFGALFVVAGGVFGYGVSQILSALNSTGGRVDTPDAAALAAADAKIDAVAGSAAFRVELTGPEMTAYVLDALQENEDNPLESIVLTVRDGEAGEQGFIEIEAVFQGGGVGATGAVTAEVVGGVIEVELLHLNAGIFEVPGIAEGALEDLIDEVGNLNHALAEAGAVVQSIEIGDGLVVVTGTRSSTDLVTSGSLLSALAENAANLSGAVSPPAEKAGPGRINDPVGTTSGSAPFYVALGDSLTANVGVDEPRHGYVSRFHNQLETLDGRAYGLRNFGVSGETTGSMIRGGQLADAVEFIENNDVAWITVGIGANNLLGHLASEDCADSLQDPACRARVEGTLDRYDDDLRTIFWDLQKAASDARIVFMQAYNPFSLGFSGSIGLEAESNSVLQEFNAIAAGVAGDFGITVADGFTPMQNTTAATTHMLDPSPDIHPNEAGFDILTCALLESLGADCPVG